MEPANMACKSHLSCHVQWREPQGRSQRPKQTRPKQNPSKTQAIIKHATTARRGKDRPLTDHFLQCDSAYPPRKAGLPSSRQVWGILPHASTNNHQPRQGQNQDQDQTPGPCYGHAYLTISGWHKIPQKQTSSLGEGGGGRGCIWEEYIFIAWTIACCSSHLNLPVPFMPCSDRWISTSSSTTSYYSRDTYYHPRSNCFRITDHSLAGVPPPILPLYATAHLGTA
jgi:hypothetical protein